MKRDPQTYRMTLDSDKQPWEQREVVLSPHNGVIDIWAEDLILVPAPGRMPTRCRIPGSQRQWLPSEMCHEHARIAEALLRDELRGQFEESAVWKLFWALVIEDKSPDNLLTRFFPKERAIYDERVFADKYLAMGAKR